MKRSSVQVGTTKPYNVKPSSPIKSSHVGIDGNVSIKAIKIGLNDSLNIKERIKEEKGLRRLSFPHNFEEKTQHILSEAHSGKKYIFPRDQKAVFSSAETQTDNVSYEDQSNHVIIRNLQSQVESLESLLQESAQYITQLSEQVSLFRIILLNKKLLIHNKNKCSTCLLLTKSVL